MLPGKTLIIKEVEWAHIPYRALNKMILNKLQLPAKQNKLDNYFIWIHDYLLMFLYMNFNNNTQYDTTNMNPENYAYNKFLLLFVLIVQYN